MSSLPRSCLGCGKKIASGSRCGACQAQVNYDHDQRRGKTAQRGYDAHWQRLSRAAIKLHPWCGDCGATGSQGNPLTGDHLRWPAEAVDDVAVVCRRCNSKRGARRGRNLEQDASMTPAAAEMLERIRPGPVGFA